MSLFGSLMGDVEDDPFFGSHMRHMRQMNNMMNSLFSDPFGMLGGGPLAIGGPRHGGAMMPFMPQMPSLNRLFTGDLDGHGHMAAAHMGAGHMGPGHMGASSFSSSTVVMSSGPNGKPQGTDVMELPRYCSASGMFAAAHVDCFYTTMRKRAASLVRRVRASPNSILSMIADRLDCPYITHCINLHVFSSSSSTKIGPNGVKETRKTLQDSRTGTKKMSIGHHIGERAHVIEREQNVYSGDQEENQEYINIEEEEAEDFNREFQQKAGALTSRGLPAIMPAPRRDPPRLALPPPPSANTSESPRRRPSARRPIRTTASPLTTSTSVREVYSGSHPQRHRHKNHKSAHRSNEN